MIWRSVFTIADFEVFDFDIFILSVVHLIMTRDDTNIKKTPKEKSFLIDII